TKLLLLRGKVLLLDAKLLLLRDQVQKIGGDGEDDSLSRATEIEPARLEVLLRLAQGVSVLPAVEQRDVAPEVAVRAERIPPLACDTMATTASPRRMCRTRALRAPGDSTSRVIRTGVPGWD